MILSTSSPSTSPSNREWDLLVVGGGTAGIIAAKTAVGLGARVLMVEQDQPGGDCLWTGCVPSKALLAAAHAAADARTAGRLGIQVEAVNVDFAAVMSHVHSAIAAIEPDDSPETLRAAGVELVAGAARFTGPGTAVIGADEVRFSQALVATGAQPVVPPIRGLEEMQPLTSETVWDLERLPVRLVVLGGGTTGCELGQAFARLGSQVTLIETGPRLLQGEDPEAAELVTRQLREDGVTVLTGSEAVDFVTAAGSGTVRLADGTLVEFDDVLLAVGRRPRTADLGLDFVDVAVDGSGYVAVSDRLQTSNPHIWAAGDVTAFSRFTHTAGVHGSIAATNAVLGLRRTIDEAEPARVTFTQPEVAAVGVTGTAAEREGFSVITKQHAHLDRAQADGRTVGFSRLVLDAKGRVVGATIVGPRAGESLGEVVVAVRHGLRARDLTSATHPYPTYSDGIWNASIDHTMRRLAAPRSRQVTSTLARARRWWVSR